MSRHPARVALAAAPALMLAAALGALAIEPGAPSAPVRNETDEAVRTPQTIVRSWPERPRLAALAMIEKYGAPQIADADSLSWVGNGPWDDTVVRRGAGPGGSIQQSVHYPVSLTKLAAVRNIGGRIDYDPSSGELSSTADAEGLNILALNLADEVVSGKRSAEQAREAYRRTSELAAAGKSSRYTSSLLFPRR
jgi:hypothetical protein